MTQGVTTGTTITFGTSSFPAQLKSVSVDGIERETLEITHMGSTTYREFLPGKLINAGTIQLTIFGDASSTPPINAAAETVTLTFGLVGSQTTGANVAGTAFVTAYNLSGDLEDTWEQEVTVMWDGGTGPTWTAGS